MSVLDICVGAESAMKCGQKVTHVEEVTNWSAEYVNGWLKQ